MRNVVDDARRSEKQAVKPAVTAAHSKKTGSWLVFLALVVFWQGVSAARLVPPYMLPGPLEVGLALLHDFPLLVRHSCRTLFEALTGLALGIAAAFVLALSMDASRRLKSMVSPLLLLTQTIPTVALAPLLVLWMGFGPAPKIALVFLTCFFPAAIALLNGFEDADPDAIRLLRSMGASKPQIYRYIKIPGSLGAFFAGIKISGAYAIAAAVIAEWLGGDSGLGVYMTRVRKSYSFDKMFAVIIITAVLSIALMKLLECVERRVTPWNFIRNGV